MQILMPGYMEPTRIYSLQDVDGELTLKQTHNLTHHSLKAAAELLNEQQTILVDSGYPEAIEQLQAMRYHVIGGRL